MKRPTTVTCLASLVSRAIYVTPPPRSSVLRDGRGLSANAAGTGTSLQRRIGVPRLSVCPEVAAGLCLSGLWWSRPRSPCRFRSNSRARYCPTAASNSSPVTPTAGRCRRATSRALKSRPAPTCRRAGARWLPRPASFPTRFLRVVEHCFSPAKKPVELRRPFGKHLAHAFTSLFGSGQRH